VEPQALRETLRALLAAGLIRAQTIAESEGLDFSEFFGATSPAASPAVQASAESEAAGGTPKLERQGYYVSIARQAVKAAAASGLSVLIVEDDPDMSALVARLLVKEGFETEVVATREEIVARLRTPPLPDLIILDLNLPGLSGFQVLERLKASAALKAVPVILLTADTARASIVRGLAGGADGYITKPFEKASLVTGVRAVLGLDPS
jgi:CheY-like chemotaxis protein